MGDVGLRRTVKHLFRDGSTLFLGSVPKEAPEERPQA